VDGGPIRHHAGLRRGLSLTDTDLGRLPRGPAVMTGRPPPVDRGPDLGFAAHSGAADPGPDGRDHVSTCCAWRPPGTTPRSCTALPPLAGACPLAISSTSARTACVVRGRPGLRRGDAHRFLTRSAGQRSKVRGRRSGAPGGGGPWAAAGPARTRPPGQPRTASVLEHGAGERRVGGASSWHKMRISASLARSERASKASQPNTRSTAR